jgi:oxygen-independent coproporphyrinogen III oxidase
MVNLGIYIHIPFCQARCNYCHFISIPFSQATEARYQKAVLGEMESFSDLPEDVGIDSIYFGGGTPGLIPVEHIDELLAAGSHRFSVLEDCEISLEANPGTLSAEKVASFRQSGVNRISLGAQSFNDAELSSIGRLHTADMIASAIAQLRQGGFTNFSLDLMLGLPGQTTKNWMRNLENVEHLEVPHVSVYMLDLDDQCPLQAMVASGSVQLPDEDLISDLYLETISFLSLRGYRQYEISNFALPGFSCRHNLKYWQRKPFRGFGLGSHSFNGQSRCSNFSDLGSYFNAVERGQCPVEWREEVSPTQSLAESLFLGLRLTQGVNLVKLRAIYGQDCLARYESGMLEFVHKKLVEWTDSVVRLTPAGMLLSNEVFQLFV